MLTISVIGSAGRKDDSARVNQRLYEQGVEYLVKCIDRLDQPITIVSGGAAFVDHMAVALYLRNQVDHLILHLPAGFNNSKFTETRTGRTANYYHNLFKNKTGISSLRQIQQAIDKGATVYTYNGFKQRNLQVANSNRIIAMTFGTHTGLYGPADAGWRSSSDGGLKPGGTAHTWHNSNAPQKIHKNLYDFL